MDKNVQKGAQGLMFYFFGKEIIFYFYLARML